MATKPTPFLDWNINLRGLLPGSALIVVFFGWIATSLGLSRTIGMVVGALLIMVAACIFYRRRRKHRGDDDEMWLS